MKAKLIGCTQPASDSVEGLQDVQDLVAYCAKVSNQKGQMNLETSERLLAYLIKHKHRSPFEMASATIEVETTRDIARQFLRHRSFAFHELQRFHPSNLGQHIFEVREARMQDEKNRQNSIECEDDNIKEQWEEEQLQVILKAKQAYDWAIDNGIAKEQARAVLPEGNTKSRLYANGTIRSWIHYVELRSANGTQKEHMELAREIGCAIHAIFPMIEDFINE